MRTFWKWALALAVPAVWAAAAGAQERHVPEGTTIKLLLLRQKSVQQELGITPEVAEKVKEFTHAEGEAFLKARELGEDERRNAYRQLAEKNHEFLTKTLTEKQNQRLNQISLQVTALHELLKPETSRALNLTDDQLQKLKDLQKEARKELGDIIYAKEAEGRNEKLADLREKTRTKVLAVLTDEQKEKVREMAGPPFKGEIKFEEPESP
jgi:hypothetical protein